MLPAADHRRLRVAFVIDKYPPFIGGAERQAQLLAQLVSQRLGHCDVFTAQPDAESDPSGVSVHPLGDSRPHRRRHLVSFTKSFREFARRDHSQEIVHGHALSGLVCGAVLGARRRGGAALVKLCSVGPQGDIAKLRRHPFGRWLWPLIRRPAFFVVPTPDLRREVIAAGVSSDRIAVIPNALATFPSAPLGAEGKAAARAELGLPDRPIVLFVGRLSPEKGLDILMRAWDQVAERCDAILVIVGAGPESARLTAWARESGHGDRVRLVGARLDADRFYRAADVLAVPSRTESFSNVTAEAMASGLAVVTTPVGLSTHWIRHGEHGLIVRGEDGREMASALGTLVRDVALRERLAVAARPVALAAFSADSIVDRYVDLYERLTASVVRPTMARADRHA
jgi:glycosyltransferase involved in cell wall biosynthesis